MQHEVKNGGGCLKGGDTEVLIINIKGGEMCLHRENQYKIELSSENKSQINI